MAVIWRDDELSLEPLASKTVAVLGFGSQGRAQSLNLRDSGIQIIIGLRDSSPSRAEAETLGFRVVPMKDAVANADVIAVLLPEGAHKDVFENTVNPHLKQEAALVFAHGFNVHYGVISPREDLQRLLVAPKAIGPELRRLYEQGSGAAALIAAEPGDLKLARAYAKALGCGRAAVIASSFREETETDLFGEQAVLCGGMPELARAAFDTLVEAGYQPEAAYFECLFEIKLIADMMFERGIAGMVERISDTAQFGAMAAGPRVITNETRQALRQLLSEIQSGEFARKWAEEQAAGSPHVREWRTRLASTQIERVRKELER